MNLSDPHWRAVYEDGLREKGAWSGAALMLRMGILSADANANANAYADANANADADADAYANANANAVPPLNLSGGTHVKPGLYLFSTQSGNLVVLRIGWVQRVEGDEYEALNMVTPLRNDYSKMFADAAIDGPPKGWKYTRPLPRPSPLNRFHILGPVSLDPSTVGWENKSWNDICPKPKGWAHE